MLTEKKAGADTLLVLKALSEASNVELSLAKCSSGDEFFHDIMNDLSFSDKASLYIDLAQALTSHKYCDQSNVKNVCTALKPATDSAVVLQSLVNDILYNLSVIKPLQDKTTISSEDMSDETSTRVYEHFTSMEKALELLKKDPANASSAENYSTVQTKIVELKERTEPTDAEKSSDKTEEEQRGEKVRGWLEDFLTCN